MSRNCYTTLLLRVFILLMASLLIHLKPSILFYYLYHISNLHITIFKLSHTSIQVKLLQVTTNEVLSMLVVVFELCLLWIELLNQ